MEKPTEMKILIVGAGIGGLSLGSFLQKRGFTFKIIEKQKDFSHHGFALGMWQNGFKMLEKLGLKDFFEKNKYTYDSIEFFHLQKKVRSLSLHSFNKFGGYSHIKRKDLIDQLSACVPKEKIVFDMTISHLINKENKVIVSFSNGKQEVFDLVVGADGINSAIREDYIKPFKRNFINWRSWYVWISSAHLSPNKISKFFDKNLYVVIFYEKDRSLAVIVAHQNHTVWDNEESRKDHLKQILKDENIVFEMIEKEPQKEIVPTDLSEVNLNTCSKGRIVLIGDSFHGFLPFAGLGGSMALEDAYLLAESLHLLQDPDKAICIYEKLRKPRIQKARQLTNFIRLFLLQRTNFSSFLISKLICFLPEYLFVRAFKKFMNTNISYDQRN